MQKRKCIFVILLLIIMVVVGKPGFAATPQDTIVYGCNQIVRSLDPIKAICWEEKSLEFNMYDTLIGFDPVDISIWEPRLAERWEVSSDGTVWTFYLRQGVRFSSGNEMTAKDVLFSLKRGVAGNFPTYPPVAKYLDVESGLEALDDYTVQMTLKVPYAGFGQLLTSINTAVIDSEVINSYITAEDPHGSNYLDDQSAGTGPLKLDEWTRGQRIVLVPNENYWGKELNFRVPRFERLIDLHVPEPTVQKMMLERGDIDMAFDLTSEMIAEYEDSGSGIKVEKVPIFIGTGMIMNPSRGIFQDRNVRKAIRFAIDYDSIISILLKDNAIRLDRPIFTPFVGSNDTTEYLYYYDLSKAQTLMAESSYPNGGDFGLVIGTGSGFGAPWDIIALKIAADLEQIGIRVHLEQYDWSAVDEKQFNGNYDALLMWFTIPFNETEGQMMGQGHTAQASWLRQNPYVNKDIDELVEEATTELNQDRRVQLYNEISRIFMEDGPYAFIAQQKKPFVFRENVFGFDMSPEATLINFSVLYKE